MPDDQSESSFWSKTTKIATAILAVAAVAGPVFKYIQTRYKEQHPTVIGVWSGRPADHRFPPLSVTIYPNLDSSLSGTLSSPCENVTSTPLASVTLDNIDFKFTVTDLAGSPPINYIGRVEQSSPPQIVGKVTQGSVDSSWILNQGEWKGDCDK